jgi:hypothetical protein
MEEFNNDVMEHHNESEDTQLVENELQFPINQELLESASKAKEEWRVIRDRLAKIEEHREKVTKVVYERVLADYKARIQGVTDAVLEKKQDVDQELASLAETRNSIAQELEGHRHTLEEIKFRNTLGEFSEEQYQTKAREEQDKISKFETVLSAVNSNIHRYEAIFGGEPDLFAAEGEAPAVAEPEHEEPEVSGLTPIAPTHEPMTDEAGYVIEEGEADYFSVTAPDSTNPAIEESNTSPTASDIVVPGRIVIINGEEAGTAYPLKSMISFGRAESNTVTIRDAKVSRQHAQIQQQGNEFVLIDLNSSNGTYINGERVEEHVLTNGDEIQIGDCIMQFQL